jgi:hypothetical protein
MHKRNFTKKLIFSRLMTFRVDKVFQGTKSSVIQQIFDGWAPHVIGVHCMVHKTNMVGQILSHLQMVSNLRVYFRPCTSIFPRSLKDIWNL